MLAITTRRRTVLIRRAAVFLLSGMAGGSGLSRKPVAAPD